MKCPHCSVGVHPDFHWTYVGKDEKGTWALQSMVCPACHLLIVALGCGEPAFTTVGHSPNTFSHLSQVREWRLVRPKGSMRPACPTEVQKDAPRIASDYAEACLVLADSPKAS